MLFVRQATDSDESEIVELGRLATEECFPWVRFDRLKATQLVLSSLREPPYVFFVAEEARKLVGFSLCAHAPLPFAYGFSCVQHVLYVRPDKRGSRASAELILAFSRWVDRLQPVEAQILLASGQRPEAVARFVRRFGFKPIGHVLHKVCG